MYADNAPECLTPLIPLSTKGVDLSTSSAYTPQSSGLAEKMNRPLLGKSGSLMNHTRSGHQCWGEGLLHAVYSYMRTSTAVLSMSKAHERLFGGASNNTNMRVSGCAAYVYRHETQTSSKFDSRAEMGVYMGNRDYPHRI